MPPKPRLTHFLCLPLVTSISKPQLQTSLARFAADVSLPNEAGVSKLPAKAIRPAGAIHLTIGVMSLLTPERIEAACSHLHSLDLCALRNATKNPGSEAEGEINKAEPATTPATAIEQQLPQPLLTTLSGLHTMNTPTKTSLLFAQPLLTPDPTGASHHTQLAHLGTALRTSFTTAGFLVPETRPLRLHATIVNTIYARKAVSGKNRWKGGSGKIDATDLIARYEGFEWAKDVRIEKVAICEMGVKDVLEGGKVVGQEYMEVASVALP